MPDELELALPALPVPLELAEAFEELAEAEEEADGTADELEAD